MILDGRTLTPGAVEAVARGGEQVELSGEARERNAAAAQALDELVAGGEQVYGVTTGVGPFRTHPVPEDRRGDQQLRLLRSHASGGGRELPAELVRAAMVVRANQIGAGGAGVSEELLDALVDALNAGVDSGGARDRLARDGRSHGARGDRAGPDRPLSAGARIARRARLHEQQRGIDRPRRAGRGRGRSPARRRSRGWRPVIPRGGCRPGRARRARAPGAATSGPGGRRGATARAARRGARRPARVGRRDRRVPRDRTRARPSRIRSRSARCLRSRAPRATR